MSETKEKRSVEPADLFRLNILQQAELSPDGEQVAYCVSKVDPEKEDETAALWILTIETGETRKLTTGKARDHSPKWSPNGKQIAFLSTREGSPQVFVIPVDGGEAKAVTSMTQSIGGGPAWSPDGKYIAFTAGPKMDAPPDPSKPYRVTRHIYRFDPIGYLHLAVQDIHIVPCAGGEPKQLTNDENMNTNPSWSPDGQEILFTSAFKPHSHQPSMQLKLVDLKGKVRTIVSSDWGEVSTAGWVPNGKYILFIGTQRDAPIGTKSDLWIVKRHGSEPECRTAGLKGQVGGGLQPDFPAMPSTVIAVNKAGTTAFVNVQEGGKVQIYKIVLHGEEACLPIVSGERSVFLCDMNEEKLLFSDITMHSPPEVAIADIDGEDEKMLTHFNVDVIGEWKLPKIERLVFSGAEDVQIEGWIMIPPEGEAPYPTILYIHGGPQGAFGHTFTFDFQMLAGAGYAVLFINPQGSTGYGSDFATSIIADLGNRDYRDLMAGVDDVIKKGIADPHRMGVSGISYGGYMSCWIVGHTDRFKAAIPENPVTDFYSLYGTSDISAWICNEMFGGKLHEVPEVYRKCSPITFAHNCTTPTLLIQGENDYRCPVGQSEQFYTTLKANGCIVEMLRFPNSSHIMSIGGPPIMRRTQNEEILKWMNQYVRGVTHEE